MFVISREHGLKLLILIILMFHTKMQKKYGILMYLNVVISEDTDL